MQNGRDGWIRTSDPLLPKQVRYQATLRPEMWWTRIAELNCVWMLCRHLPNRPAHARYMERGTGIEPASTAWKAATLPLS